MQAKLLTSQHGQKLQYYRKFDYEVCAAFQKDCSKLLQHFEAQDDMSFASFVKIWKDMSFSLVFAGLNCIVDAERFTQNCFYVAKKFLIDQTNLHVQVGSLYLMYGLFYKQPNTNLNANLIKIRLTLSEYKILQGLVERMQKLFVMDAIYIYTKLKVANAFLYVLTDEPLGPEDKFTPRDEIVVVTSRGNITEDLIRNYKDAAMGPTLQKINSEYDQALQEFKRANPSVVVTLFGSDLQQDLEKAYGDMVVAEQGTDAEESELPETSASPPQSILELRRKIKEKAMGVNVKSQRQQ